MFSAAVVVTLPHTQALRSVEESGIIFIDEIDKLAETDTATSSKGGHVKVSDVTTVCNFKRRGTIWISSFIPIYFTMQCQSVTGRGCAEGVAYAH